MPTLPKSKPIFIPSPPIHRDAWPHPQRTHIPHTGGAKHEIATLPFAAPEPVSPDKPADTEPKYKLPAILRVVERPRHFRDGHPRFANAFERFGMGPGSLAEWEVVEMGGVLYMAVGAEDDGEAEAREDRRVEERREIAAAEVWEGKMEGGVENVWALVGGQVRLPVMVGGGAEKWRRRWAREDLVVHEDTRFPRREVLPVPVLVSALDVEAQVPETVERFYRRRAKRILPPSEVSMETEESDSTDDRSGKVVRELRGAMDGELASGLCTDLELGLRPACDLGSAMASSANLRSMNSEAVLGPRRGEAVARAVPHPDRSLMPGEVESDAADLDLMRSSTVGRRGGHVHPTTTHDAYTAGIGFAVDDEDDASGRNAIVATGRFPDDISPLHQHPVPVRGVAGDGESLDMATIIEEAQMLVRKAQHPRERAFFGRLCVCLRARHENSGHVG